MYVYNRLIRKSIIMFRDLLLALTGYHWLCDGQTDKPTLKQMQTLDKYKPAKIMDLIQTQGRNTRLPLPRIKLQSAQEGLREIERK